MRSPRSAAAALLLAVACSDASGPSAGLPARVIVTAAPATSAQVSSAAGTLAVRVADERGSPVAGALVRFSAAPAASLSPSSAMTDAGGEARTSVTLGTMSGPVTITATVTGSSATASAVVSAVAGPLRSLVASPESKRLYGLGDTVRVVATGSDQYGNPTAASAIRFAVTDSSLVSIDSAGLVRVLRQGGSALVIVTSEGSADSVSLTVLAPGATACTGVAAPAPLAVGQYVTLAGVRNGCVVGGGAGAEYALVAFNGTLSGSSMLTATVTGEEIGAAPTGALSPDGAALGSLSPLAFGASPAVLRQDDAVHLRLQERARATLEGRAADARLWQRARRSTPTGAARSLSGASTASGIPREPVLGEMVRVNVNADQPCASPVYHSARIAAVGTRSIVLADADNPSGGFTDADYERFAARFDTLVYPLDVENFGAPSDIDGNGRVAILFTRAVNELTPRGSASFVGGFFYSRDLYPATGSPSTACGGSNEGEMFYMLVPDPGGEVNGNVRRTGFVDTLTTAVIAHELQHLINSSRRLYVTNRPESSQFEAVWLNEGLSHVAEELLYYRESGLAPRRNLSDADIRTANPSIYRFFKADASANFSRLASYLGSAPERSPIAGGDELATRGAAWSFLRYAVDQADGTDALLWSRFVDSPSTGLGTVRHALGRDPAALLRTWTLANVADDAGVAVGRALTHPSWNFRGIYGGTYGSYNAAGTVFTPMGYPLKAAALVDGSPATTSVRGGSAAYYRFSVPANREALLTFGSGTAAPEAGLEFLVLRTR